MCWGDQNDIKRQHLDDDVLAIHSLQRPTFFPKKPAELATNPGALLWFLKAYHHVQSTFQFPGKSSNPWNSQAPKRNNQRPLPTLVDSCRQVQWPRNQGFTLSKMNGCFTYSHHPPCTPENHLNQTSMTLGLEIWIFRRRSHQVLNQWVKFRGKWCFGIQSGYTKVTVSLS